VRRVPSPTDRRANQLQLTASGARLWAKVQSPAIAAQDRALATLREHLVDVNDLTRRPVVDDDRRPLPFLRWFEGHVYFLSRKAPRLARAKRAQADAATSEAEPR
jgi:hypothetical protein